MVTKKRVIVKDCATKRMITVSARGWDEAISKAKRAWGTGCVRANLTVVGLAPAVATA